MLCSIVWKSTMRWLKEGLSCVIVALPLFTSESAFSSSYVNLHSEQASRDILKWTWFHGCVLLDHFHCYDWCDGFLLCRTWISVQKSSEHHRPVADDRVQSHFESSQTSSWPNKLLDAFSLALFWCWRLDMLARPRLTRRMTWRITKRMKKKK